MSPVDAKNETNLNRVRVFSGDQFIKSIACQKWDLVKFVCSQPFNKTLQYGISFVFFHTPANANPAADDKNIKVDSLLNDEESDSTQFKPGSLFQASRQTSCDKDNSQPKSSNKLNALKHSSNLIQNANTSSSLLVSRPDDHHSSSKASTSSHQSHSRPPTNTGIIRSSQSSRISKNKEEYKQSKTSHSTQKPLSNVILTLSGYQNPLRSQIRDKALELGAKYRQDWGPDCTHLICAFPNTPKFNLVKGKGIIVSDKWITQCYETKSNVPWRSYRVGRAPSPPNTATLSSTLNQSLNDDDDDDGQSPKSKSSVHKTNLRLRGKKKSDDDDWQPGSSDEEADNDDDDDEFQETDEDEDNGEEEGSDEDLSDESNRRRKRKSKTNSKNLQKRPRSTTNDGSNAKKTVTANDPEDENTDDEIQSSQISITENLLCGFYQLDFFTSHYSKNDLQGVTVNVFFPVLVAARFHNADHMRVMTSSRNQLSVVHEDEDEETIKESLMNSLPDIFMNKHFFIHNKSIPDDEESLIKRLIVAFAGTYVLSCKNSVT
uniref:DNA repair protein XRCC1 n=1 Tax=Schistosoma haematobium TaxID=6185 RepID=A0A094ZDN4_SCHHA